MSRGILIVISGFSGVGKGTVIKELLTDNNEYCLSVSATTRKPRTGEEDGKDYFFMSAEEFKDKISRDEFIEYAKYVGNYYGTPKDYVKERLDQGYNVILEIETQGALKVKEAIPDAVLIFISPPSSKILIDRLVSRGTEDFAQIKQRLDTAKEEAHSMINYDYIVINDELKEAVEKIKKIIDANKMKSCHRKNLINNIIEDMNKI